MPLAAICSHDGVAAQFCRVTRTLGIRIPSDVAVLGVDNNPLICECCRPMLSSIDLDFEGQGYEAARMLHGILRGRRKGRPEVLLPPREVVERESTRGISVSDPVFRAALQKIHEEPTTVTVGNLVRMAHASRRTFETRFKRTMGCSPHEEILRVRVGLARQLIAKTDKPITEIALESGFSGSSHIAVAFRRILGAPPSSFRKKGTGRDVRGR
jgi:LacI family transcriptional regulator